MIGDLKLLQLAAKAIGLEGDVEGFHTRPLGIYTGPIRPDGMSYWNPITTDADALRLLVSLLLDIRHTGDEVSVFALGVWFTEPVYMDRLEATRRAIVRAAASIGEVMP
jgi:hypothetical protein